METTIFHPLDLCSATSTQLNNPFRVRVSDEIAMAQRVVMEHLNLLSAEDQEVGDELRSGKMMGVMIVRDSFDRIGFLAGFSGCMAGRHEVAGFVPPIDGRGEMCQDFVEQDRAIGAMGREIEQLESSPDYLLAVASHRALLQRVEREREEISRAYTESRRLRKEQRAAGVRPLAEIERESQHQKGEMRRMECSFRDQIEESNRVIESMQSRVEQLRERRRGLSNTLQRSMFESYQVLNGLGDLRSLYSIFDEANGRLPPSGAGECAAPKMLHYAFKHALQPLSIGEFWYGGSSRGEVRQHGYLYAACKSRCEPILKYMLQGVDVEPLVLSEERSLRSELRVVFEDQHLVLFNKPAGMLSVPGRSSAESVASIARELYPDATGAMMVHRLDQETSGLLLVAKSAEVHKALQRQFAQRTLSKRYVAVVEGVVADESGEITLPLMPNIEDRPRQMVSREHGKVAHTTYEVVERSEGRTRLNLTPHTGRTHQLRVHCADQDGLSSPIVGDRLYGRAAQRMLLHAEQISFCHPISGEELFFCSPAQF